MAPWKSSSDPKSEEPACSLLDGDGKTAFDEAQKASGSLAEVSKAEKMINKLGTSAQLDDVALFLTPSDTEDRIISAQKPKSPYLPIAKDLYSQNGKAITSVASAVTNGAAGHIVIDMEAIEAKVKTFAETSKVLMKVLDEVAKVHPFVEGKSVTSTAT
jgi:hypothetical protein